MPNVGTVHDVYAPGPGARNTTRTVTQNDCVHRHESISFAEGRPRRCPHGHEPRVQFLYRCTGVMKSCGCPRRRNGVLADVRVEASPEDRRSGGCPGEWRRGRGQVGSVYTCGSGPPAQGSKTQRPSGVSAARGALTLPYGPLPAHDGAGSEPPASRSGRRETAVSGEIPEV